MRPKFIFIFLFISLAFLLTLLSSPGLEHRKARDKALSAWIQNPTPENKRAIELVHEKARRSQDIVLGLAVLNVVAILVYRGWQHRKGMI